MRERKKLRLNNFDYASKGSYFVTMCVHNRGHVFGKIENDNIMLNQYGEIVKKQWEWLFNQYSYIQTDKYVVMPNHFHGIIIINGNNNDSEELKSHHIDNKKEKELRKQFTKFNEKPKILIVTEKLLTGYDAPILYAMYLDKPMRDHTLLQAIARVNRPYENELQNMVKPHGFVLDFVGIFENMEKALAFDSDEVNAIVKDINLLMSIEKIAEAESEDPFLIGLMERAEQVQARYEDRQTSTQEAIAELLGEIEKENQRKKEQAEK